MRARIDNTHALATAKTAQGTVPYPRPWRRWGEKHGLQHGQVLTSLLVVALGSSVPATPSAAQAYAPKAELPAGSDANSMVALMLLDANVPSREAVGVPAYPGARLVQVMEMPNPVTREVQGSVRLISSDTAETVSAWYTDNLLGWSRQEAEAYGITGFGEGGREFNPMNPQTWGVLPSVAISEDDTYGEIWPDVNTVIEINYPLPAR